MDFLSRPHQSRVDINDKVAVTDRAVVDVGNVNDCDQQTALRGINPAFLQIGKCVDSAVAEEGPVRSSRID